MEENNIPEEKYICDKSNCSGCMACFNACPRDAITIVKDKDGFEYPVKNEKCINCGLCSKICPSMNIVPGAKESDQVVIATKSKEEDILIKSSSGGAFTTIAQAFCDKNYVIFGVEFDENLKAAHSYITDISEIDKYRKSKYVQSHIGNSYSEAKKFLEEGKKVLFTGTPCQIAGLKSFLKKDYDNLLTADIICHGTPSPKVLEKYLQYMQSKCKSKPKSFNFREKVKIGGEWNSKCFKIELENGKKLIEDSHKNTFLRGFQAALFYRPSCYSCKYATPARVSDITMADCWGLQKTDCKWDIHHGVSMIVINTDKGKKLLDEIKNNCDCYDLNVDFAKKENSHFRKPANPNNKREFFYENLDNMQFNKLIDTCIPPQRIRHFIGRMIPKKLKKALGR